jgi:serine/threonine-protein kinase
MSNSKPSDIFQAGDLLNNTYRIEDILGRGGTSEVYKARSEISKRVVALKALRAEFSMMKVN